jgi:hypothetical protein
MPFLTGLAEGLAVNSNTPAPNNMEKSARALAGYQRIKPARHSRPLCAAALIILAENSSFLPLSIT